MGRTLHPTLLRPGLTRLSVRSMTKCQERLHRPLRILKRARQLGGDVDRLQNVSKTRVKSRELRRTVEHEPRWPSDCGSTPCDQKWRAITMLENCRFRVRIPASPLVPRIRSGLSVRQFFRRRPARLAHRAWRESLPHRQFCSALALCCADPSADLHASARSPPSPCWARFPTSPRARRRATRCEKIRVRLPAINWR